MATGKVTANSVIKDARKETFVRNTYVSSENLFAPAADFAWVRMLWNLRAVGKETMKFMLWTTILAAAFVVVSLGLVVTLLDSTSFTGYSWVQALSIATILSGPVAALIIWLRLKPVVTFATKIEQQEKNALITWLSSQGLQFDDETITRWSFLATYHFSFVQENDGSNKGVDDTNGRKYTFAWAEDGYTLFLAN